MTNPAPALHKALQLRILATSDLHAHLLPWDYYLDRGQNGYGLARVAGLLRVARQEAENCLFFDNGDLIEGSPLAEHAVHAWGQGQKNVHPMVAALNALGCDAAALGNHEFSYGMPFLQQMMQDAAYPVLSANILAKMGVTVAQDVPVFAPWVMLERSFADGSGIRHDVRIGVLGLTPHQVLDWDRALLPPDLKARDMLETAAHYVPLIRAAGADVVVVLAHTGLGQKDSPLHAENIGRQIAGLPGIDALILGHEHKVFPQDRKMGASGGQPDGTATVMPGAYGSHLGVIDLDLVQDGAGWRVAGRTVECRPIARRGPRGEAVALVKPDPAIAAQAKASHQATRKYVAQPVGQTAVPLHSYFAVAQPNAMQAMIATAQAAHLAEIMAGTEWEGLPVLSAVAPFKTGGRGGPDYFTTVPAGALLLRNAADMYHYPNLFAALKVTGASLRVWLERAATTFAQVQIGRQDQPLVNPLFPPTCLEMIWGLSYQIDLSAAAAYEAPAGPRVPQHKGRIRDLRFDGNPVTDDMQFALATNSHRLGVLREVESEFRLHAIADGAGTLTSRDVLLRHLARQPAPRGRQTPAMMMDWSFCKMPGTSVALDTAPAALAHLADIAHFAPEVLGLTSEGFLRFRLHL